jgi:hypothetical protein
MKRFVHCIVCQMGLIGMIGLASPVRAGNVAYVIDTTTLYSLDLTAVSVTEIAKTGVTSMEDMAISPTGKAYVTDSHGILYSLSLATGMASRIGDTGLGDIEAITFRGSTLVGANFHDPTTFYSIDVTDAQATPLVTTTPAEGPVRAMALENGNTALCVADASGHQVLTSTNLETGATSTLGTLDSPSIIAAMAFAPDGTLYALDVSGDEYTVNPTDGALTLKGTIDPPYVGMAFAVPEPTSVVHAGFGVLILAVWVRVRMCRTPRGERARSPEPNRSEGSDAMVGQKSRK